MVGIGGSKFARAQSSGQFALVECPVVVKIKPRKQVCCGFLDLGKVECAIGVEVKRLDRIMAGKLPRQATIRLPEMPRITKG